MLSIILILTLSSTQIVATSSQINHENDNPQENHDHNIIGDSDIEKGKRWDIQNITILYINGTFYEMGYELGKLLQTEFYINHRAFQHYYETEGIFQNQLSELWNQQKQYVSQETIDFIRGCAHALEVSFEEIACIWVAEGAAYINQCSSFAAWGQATFDGELIQTRSLEFPLTIQDPLTNSFVQDYPVIVVADPDGEDYQAFIYPTYAGYVVEDGFNEKGISVTNMWSPNNDQTYEGAPMGIRLFEALYSATNAEEAIDVIVNDRTFGYNFIVSDAKVPIGYAVETTASHYYYGTWNDTVEDLYPFWQIPDVVRRTNCFLSPEIAKTQRDIYNPSHLSYWRSLFSKNPEPWPVLWNHYKSLSKGLERHWGTMNLNDSLQIMKKVYQGGYDPIWNLLLKTQHGWTTWYQWVAKPLTGEIKIRFADGETSALGTSIFSMNLLETIRNKSPL